MNTMKKEATLIYLEVTVCDLFSDWSEADRLEGYDTVESEKKFAKQLLRRLFDELKQGLSGYGIELVVNHEKISGYIPAKVHITNFAEDIDYTELDILEDSVLSILRETWDDLYKDHDSWLLTIANQQ